MRGDYAFRELAGVEGVCERWLHADLLQVRLLLTCAIRPQNLHFVSRDFAAEDAASMLPDVDAWEERDAQPTAGLNAALGSAFTTLGRHSTAPVDEDSGPTPGEAPEFGDRRAAMGGC